MEFLKNLFELDPQQVLVLTGAGAVMTTLGSLAALVIKDFFFARSFEKWKERRTLETAFRKFKDPIVLAAIELLRTLEQIAADYPSDFLDAKVLNFDPEKAQSIYADDEYYLKYKLITSVFRLCAFFGWLELYRQEIVYLDSGHSGRNSKFETCLKEIRTDFSNGRINEASWNDALLFAEEQRAIGESMIEIEEKRRVVIGYARFHELFNQKQGTVQHRWIRAATDFFFGGAKRNDFRLTRIKLAIAHLVDLIEILDQSRLTKEHRNLREKFESLVAKKNLLSDAERVPLA